MKHLIKTTEVYRFDTEENVKSFIEELKQDPHFEVVKYSSTRKQILSKRKETKGEVEDEWYHFEVVKKFDDEKEPMSNIEIIYEGE